jgi:hypothetical protein
MTKNKYKNTKYINTKIHKNAKKHLTNYKKGIYY